MAVTLYDSTVATFIQTLAAEEGFLSRGFDHCRENEIDPKDIVETRLHPDMLPFQFQVISTIAHSVGAIEGVRRGVYAPPHGQPLDYIALQAAVAEARETLTKVSREEVDGFEGRDMKFEVGGRTVPFTAENFLLSFSIPNFFFHTSMAYGILRSKGVPLGKRDFMGRLRIKR
jgi:hypothetical protein